MKTMLCCGALALVMIASPLNLPVLRLAPKPSDTAPERRALRLYIAAGNCRSRRLKGPGSRTPSPYEAAANAGHPETFDLGSGFTMWKNGTAEGKTEITEAARHNGKIGLRWTVAVDHEHDGGEGGNYPVGWPRLAREFKPGELDMSACDILDCWIRIDSNRDEVADDHTPIGLSISGHGRKGALYQKTVDLGGEQRVWLPVRFSVKQMMSATEAGKDAWKSIGRVQLHISEHDYKHGTRLSFDIGEISLLRLTTFVPRASTPAHNRY